ncbi:MAG: hemerythrin domain-containing protein [Jatrophihabitans sp.]
MSLDSTVGSTALEGLSPTPHDGATSDSPNSVVIDAIRAHHAQLAEQLHDHTDAVVAAARRGEFGPERTALHDWYRSELIPHAMAEEQSLYSPAAELDPTALLVRGMVAEHRSLVSLIADLALASDPVDVAATAVAARAVFDIHLSKENDLLLPALDQAGLDLHKILDGMHEILGHEDTSAEADGCGCGCGCGCGDAGESAPGPVSLSIGLAQPVGTGTAR